MNYKMLLVAIFISSLITLNVWAGCCFINKMDNHRQRCINTTTAKICRESGGLVDPTNNEVFFYEDKICQSNEISCCKGKSQSESNLLSIEIEVPPNCITVLLTELVSFTATVQTDHIVIKWDTAFERSNLGMNLWCAQIQGNQFKKITQLNSELIPSKAILPNYGAFYSSTDYPYVNTNLKPGIQHCTLEDLDASGQCTLHCDQLDTIVVGKGQSAPNVNLNELNAKAIALCQQYQNKLAETGQEGICLDQLLMSH